MKVAIIGDTHFGCRNDNPIFYEHFAKFYEFFFAECDLASVGAIIQTGDLFDRRKNINFLSLSHANRQFFDRIEDRQLPLYVISGNHDCFYKNTNTVNSVRLLSKPWIRVVDTVPETHIIGDLAWDFYPWLCDANSDAIRKLARESKSTVSVGHWEFANFPLHPGTPAIGGIDHNFLDRYTRVFSGHYHTSSERDNVLYVGTPYEMDWNDYMDPKGFWIYDTITGELDRKINPHRLHERIVFASGTKLVKDQLKDKIVKIVVADKPNAAEFDKFIIQANAQGPYDLKITDTVVTGAIATALKTKIEVETTQVMINSVVDLMDTHLDRDQLKLYIGEVYAEATELMKL